MWREYGDQSDNCITSLFLKEQLNIRYTLQNSLRQEICHKTGIARNSLFLGSDYTISFTASHLIYTQELGCAMPPEFHRYLRLSHADMMSVPEEVYRPL